MLCDASLHINVQLQYEREQKEKKSHTMLGKAGAG